MIVSQGGCFHHNVCQAAFWHYPAKHKLYTSETWMRKALSEANNVQRTTAHVLQNDSGLRPRNQKDKKISTALLEVHHVESLHYQVSETITTH